LFNVAEPSIQIAEHKALAAAIFLAGLTLSAIIAASPASGKSL
jgi:hypothetical protein